MTTHLLHTLLINQKATIQSVQSSSHLYQRLLDLGFTPGSCVTCVGISPGGDPTSYLIRGTIIALRREDAKHIIISNIENTQYTVALIGNPNVGKSTVFNNLTGLKQHTGNWSGKTVALASGRCSSSQYIYEIIDLPGTYSLHPHSSDEEITRDYLYSKLAHIVIIVCDSTCLERNLNLVLQVLSLNLPSVLCLNLMDEAQKNNIHINIEELSRCLNIPVIPTAARNTKHLSTLLDALDSIVAESYISTTVPSIERPNAEEYAHIYKAEDLARRVVTTQGQYHKSFSYKLDGIFTNKFTGYPIMIALLLVIFWLTIVGANYPSALLSSGFLHLQEMLTAIFTSLGAPDWLHGIIVLGMFRTLGWVVAVMLPPMAIFFPLFTLLEDMGYLPRVAYNLDKPFQKCRACGSQALCMCMGLGCNAVGVTGCRIIHSKRERLLAILTNSLVPCNGRFPIIISIASMFFLLSTNNLLATIGSSLMLTGFIILSIVITLATTKFLSSTILKGIPSSFTLELPPYRRPLLGRVLIRSILDRTLFVLGRAILVAAPAGCIIWIMANVSVGNISILSHCATILNPLGTLMGLDGMILLAFILGFPANEIVLPLILMGYLSEGALLELSNLSQMKDLLIANGWTLSTATCAILFSLFHWPCSTTLLTIKKETNSCKWTLLAAIIPTLIGFSLCILCNLLYTAISN